METTIAKKVDTAELEQKVKKMYSDVALNPEGGKTTKPQKPLN